MSISYQALKQRVLEANLDLPRLGLVSFTWGNVSARDAASGAIAIKPSGLAYECMGVDDMVVVAPDGRVLEGSRKPSSDLATHLELYRYFPALGGIVHTHSTWATAWAQACRSIPALGTTHADYFHGPVPCTDALSLAQIRGAYEHETGVAIVECLRSRGIDPASMPAALVAHHGPFTWGPDAEAAVHNAAVLELTAQMAALTLQLQPGLMPMPQPLLDRHFLRKHGPGAYYGQG